MSWIRRETEKETIQYICSHCNDYHEFREDFGERAFNENFIFCRRCGARNGTGVAPTLTPPNEPLTLAELREMDGEPVWCKYIRDTTLPSQWMIVDCEMNMCSSGKWELPFESGKWELLFEGESDDAYGRTWIAYRRPPEGEA